MTAAGETMAKDTLDKAVSTVSVAPLIVGAMNA